MTPLLKWAPPGTVRDSDRDLSGIDPEKTDYFSIEGHGVFKLITDLTIKDEMNG